MNQETLNDALLKSYGTAVLYDAARRMKLEVGMDLLRPMNNATSLVAPAFTVQFLPIGESSTRGMNMYDVMSSAPKGSALVIQVGAERWICGGNMTRFAELAGLRGIVMDGSVRDIGEIKERNYPIYARGISVRGYSSELALNSAGEKITCGGVGVATGDIVVADEDGVVVLPRADLENILFEAEEIAELDKRLGGDVEAGKPLEVLHESRLRWAVRRSRC